MLIVGGRCGVSWLVACCGSQVPLWLLRGMREDLNIWLDFLREYNGKTMIQERSEGPDYECGSDASGLGFAATFRDQWMQGAWPPHWLQEPFHIGVREVYPIWLILRMFGPTLGNSKVVFHCDNLGVVSSLTSSLPLDASSQ